MPGWIGPWEIAVVAVVALIVFGPKRLPELGSSLGRAITGFKKGMKETEDEVRDAVAEESEAESAEDRAGQKTPDQEKTGGNDTGQEK